MRIFRGHFASYSGAFVLLISRVPFFYLVCNQFDAYDTRLWDEFGFSFFPGAFVPQRVLTYPLGTGVYGVRFRPPPRTGVRAGDQILRCKIPSPNAY